MKKLLADYGMVLVLIALCVLFSILTITERIPSGLAAAPELLDKVNDECEKTDAILVVGAARKDSGALAEVLGKQLKGRKAPIKALLLDQDLIAGIGNMYADEALFEAKIHPTTPANKLKKADINRLHTAIRNVLIKALTLKGASIRNYIRPDGQPGTAHDEFNVAHGMGKQCPRCSALIERIVVRGRGTYFCPKCQPAP